MISYIVKLFIQTSKNIVLFSTCLCMTQHVFASSIKNGSDLMKQKNCASCHGSDFNHPVVSGYPRLAGQKKDYLYAALLSYTSSDPNFGRSNAIMKAQVKNLSKNDMQDIAAYLSSLKGQLVLQK
jgi:cytochrome c553